MIYDLCSTFHSQIPNTSKPTFGAFLAHFPAHEKGLLHFRFRMEDPTSDYVWLDVTSKDEVLPFYQDFIMAKILRAADVPTLRRKSVLRRKNMEAISASIVTGGAAMFAKHSNETPAAPPKKPERTAAPPNVPPKPQQDRTVYTDEAPQSSPRPAAAPSPSPRPAPASASPDILDFEPTNPMTSSSAKAASAAAAPKPAAAAPVDDILDFDSGPAAAAPASAKVSSANLAAMMDLDPTPTLNRAELKANREAEIDDRVQKAVDEKLEVSIGQLCSPSCLVQTVDLLPWNCLLFVYAARSQSSSGAGRL